MKHEGKVGVAVGTVGELCDIKLSNISINEFCLVPPQHHQTNKHNLVVFEKDGCELVNLNPRKRSKRFEHEGIYCIKRGITNSKYIPSHNDEQAGFARPVR